MFASLTHPHHFLSVYTVIALDHMITFNKMKELNTDVATMVQAIKQSTKVKLNAEENAVSRVDPLPENSDYDQRCIHVVR
jgi:UDP-N-acetylmuramate-alanine ligase